jgi:hypothetical protein
MKSDRFDPVSRDEADSSDKAYQPRVSARKRLASSDQAGRESAKLG